MVFAFLATLSPGATSAPSCDPSLPVASDDPYGYQLRGDRCEGLFRLQVSSSTLAVVSFTATFPNIKPAATATLDVNWLAPPNAGAVHLRAQSLRYGVNYRMDAVQPVLTSPYHWPLDLLSALSLQPSALGVVGWVELPVADRPRRVYLPIGLGIDQLTAPPTAYDLVLLPGVDITELYVSVAPMTWNGVRGTRDPNQQPLGLGYYPAATPISIHIDQPDESGFYRVEIGADIRGGDPQALRFDFYHRATGSAPTDR